MSNENKKPRVLAQPVNGPDVDAQAVIDALESACNLFGELKYGAAFVVASGCFRIVQCHDQLHFVRNSIKRAMMSMGDPGTRNQVLPAFDSAIKYLRHL